MKKFLAATLAASLMLMTACDDPEDQAPATEDYLIETALDQPELKESDVPSVSAQDKTAWANEVNPFGLQIIDKLSDKGNVVFSPAALHSALAMAAYGADGKTYSEIASALHFDGDREISEKLSADMQLVLRFDGQDPNSRFIMANNLWLDQKVQISDAFKDAMKTLFKAPVQICNFIDYAVYVLDKIGSWINDLTGGFVADLTDKTAKHIEFMLVSATKFEAKWAHPFDSSKTQQKRFIGSSGKEVLVDFMHLIYDFEYYESVEKGYQAIVIPYMDDIFDMVIILPNDASNAKEALKSISAEDFAKIHLDTPEYRLLDLSLPKFNISYDLPPSEIISRLKNIGIVEAFAEGLANFKILSPSYNVFIDSFLHHAVISIDEGGTNTGNKGNATEDKSGEATQLDIDHAFAFAIVHKASGALVYLGVVNDL
ncbi:MAG: serpin family protein [Proteobacteria bacterium]|nr:serpin family protein [Pseudomonadota bacterium]